MMRERGLRQGQVAKALGVSESLVSRWFNRSMDVPSQQVRALAALLGVSLDAVLANGVTERPVPAAVPPAVPRRRRKSPDKADAARSAEAA